MLVAQEATIGAMALVLIVEDEPGIADILEGFLRQEGYRTERAANGVQALSLFRATQPDLVLLDVLLPELDGLEVLRRIREDNRVPVILLTARSEESDKLSGLEMGADDYITKPFRPMEVVARVRATLRRAHWAAQPGGERLRAGAIEVDTRRATASFRGEQLELTATEFRLLQHLAQHVNRTFSRAELLEAALPDSDALERVIDVHIGNLRRKLERAGAQGAIVTVRGLGFRLEANS